MAQARWRWGDLHPYDNVERRFHHTTSEPNGGLEVVAGLLHLSLRPSDDTLYDLSFYSGGIGVIDQLAVTLQAGPLLWAHVIESFRAITPEQGSCDEFYAEDFNWLLTHEEDIVASRADAVTFINEERRSFQRACVLTDQILFEHGSDVNDYVVFWGDESVLN